ncbi:hypothetical protein GCM10023186_10350 [Hymenobacter koreensis]|uniref:T9SS type A sorting domain-containing protein n=2 Tax=Hymenobacter koreensis TaxID=1084523 RepID=A0ABP8IWA9_9BACT
MGTAANAQVGEKGVMEKLAPPLRQLAARNSSLQTVRVSSRQPAALQQWVRQQAPKARITPNAPDLFTVTGLSNAQIQALAASPAVLFVDVAERPAREERLISFADLSANRVSLVHRQLPQLTGAGLVVSVKENAFDPADIDFKGRVVNGAPAGTITSPHATIMSTLIAGAGNSGPSAKGVAWQARLTPASFASFLPDNGQTLTQAGVSVQNHSYGSSAGVENYYGTEAREYDRHTREFPKLLHVFSSGNSGNQTSTEGLYRGVAKFANLTGQFKMSKNTLSVGATDLLGQVSVRSSRGPAHDGRVKPELVAYGDGGTSEAAAMVSGISLLVQQAYRDQHAGALPNASLLKAVLLNSADDGGRPEVDYENGYGRVDALGAVQTISQNRFVEAASTQGVVRTFPITVPAGMQQLKVTLAWHDAEAAANAARALVNDLDLELVHVATGRRWQPWVLSSFPHADSLALPARRGIDRLNNIEQITVAVPAAGTYELQVRGHSVPSGPQSFSLAYEWEAGFSWTRPLAGENLRPSEANVLRWQWRGAATPARLEYRYAGTNAWQVISAVNLTDQQYTWTVPPTEQVAEVRLVAGNAVWPSGNVTITRRPLLEVGYACPEEALLYWPRVPGATQYQLYRLGATHLEPFRLTTDTVLFVDRRQDSNVFFAVAPILQGLEGQRSYTLDYTEQGVSCYVKSFQARQIVTDTVTFDLEIGSTYRLQSATLERQTESGFEAVQTITNIAQLRLAFTDDLTTPGHYDYRARLVTTDGKVYFTQLETVILVNESSVLVYPNPVPNGKLLNIVTGSSEAVTIRIYDLRGRLMRETTETGAIPAVDPAGLKQGTYIFRISTPGGPVTTRRVVIL